MTCNNTENTISNILTKLYTVYDVVELIENGRKSTNGKHYDHVTIKSILTKLDNQTLDEILENMENLDRSLSKFKLIGVKITTRARIHYNGTSIDTIIDSIDTPDNNQSFTLNFGSLLNGNIIPSMRFIDQTTSSGSCKLDISSLNIDEIGHQVINKLSIVMFKPYGALYNILFDKLPLKYNKSNEIVIYTKEALDNLIDKECSDYLIRKINNKEINSVSDWVLLEKMSTMVSLVILKTVSNLDKNKLIVLSDDTYTSLRRISLVTTTKKDKMAVHIQKLAKILSIKITEESTEELIYTEEYNRLIKDL